MVLRGATGEDTCATGAKDSEATESDSMAIKSDDGERADWRFRVVRQNGQITN